MKRLEILLKLVNKCESYTMEEMLKDKYVEVLYDDFNALKEIADYIRFDYDYEIEILGIDGIEVSYDPYEDWDAWEI